MTDNIIALVQILLDNPLVKPVLILLAANVLLGIAVSLYTKTFALAAVADWLMTRAIPYVLGGAVMTMLSYGLPAMFGPLVSDGTWAFVIAALVGHVLDNFRMLGIPIPDPLTDRPKVIEATRVHRAVFHTPDSHLHRYP